MEIINVNDPRFKKYGRVLEGYDFNELIAAMEQTEISENVVYEPSVKCLEELAIAEEFRVRAYGELPIQIGYCNGNNYKLNAIEYHRSSELNIAITEAVLILGMQQDIDGEYTYDTSKMEAFFVPAGVGVEIFGTTLHYAPCNANDKGFKVVVVLPKGTNYPLSECHGLGEDKLIAATNKWLIGHPDGGNSENVFIGLKGENLSVE